MLDKIEFVVTGDSKRIVADAMALSVSGCGACMACKRWQQILKRRALLSVSTRLSGITGAASRQTCGNRIRGRGRLDPGLI
ncbi:MAG: hypothetical protein NVSMB6_00580 [Burkholderiaceae bacterium]